MNRLFYNNGARWRLLRTIIQGIIGVLIANVDYLVGVFHFTPEAKVIIVAMVMAILSPIMAAMGTGEMSKIDVPEDYYEGGEDDGESE